VNALRHSSTGSILLRAGKGNNWLRSLLLQVTGFGEGEFQATSFRTLKS